MHSRIVITGVGLTSPNANNLTDFRHALLNNISGITHKEIRHIGKVSLGECDFDEFKYQKKKSRRRGTRAGSIAIYSANEAILDSKIDFKAFDKNRIGIYLGITEHGSVETEHEIHDLYNNNDLDISLWSHHHNPRTVSNAPAGEVALNLQITGPAYTIGAACAGGNMGIIQACQMLQLKEVDLALAGGVSESSNTFGIFAAFKSQGALAHNENPTMASRPLDRDRNGIVISEGGAIFTLERLEDAIQRNANIICEVTGYHTNSDATDFVLPNKDRQIECIQNSLKKANLKNDDIDLVNIHATGTQLGDKLEAEAINTVFKTSTKTFINCTKGFIGHTMGAAGALELAGNLPSFNDNLVHPCMGITNLDPACEIKNLVYKKEISKEVNHILNNSFGMLGINSTVIVSRYV